MSKKKDIVGIDRQKKIDGVKDELNRVIKSMENGKVDMATINRRNFLEVKLKELSTPIDKNIGKTTEVYIGTI